MDYRKKYNEALERAKELIAKWQGMNKDFYTEDYSYIFPELRESEDERIRKFLIKLVNDGLTSFPDSLTRSDVLDYLEKQKESTWTEEDERFRKYILPRILNPTSWTLEQVEADRGLLKEFVERQKSKWTEKQKEQKPVEWKPQPESLEALMYAIEGKWDMIPPTSYLSRRLEDLYEGLVNTYHVDESLITELHKVASEEDIEALGELKRKIDASMDKNPVEWSEEDEERYISCLQRLGTGDPKQPETINSKWFREHISYNSWKPSERQMANLINIRNYVARVSGDWGEVLDSLIEDLKKLMKK